MVMDKKKIGSDVAILISEYIKLCFFLVIPAFVDKCRSLIWTECKKMGSGVSLGAKKDGNRSQNGVRGFLRMNSKRFLQREEKAARRTEAEWQTDLQLLRFSLLLRSEVPHSSVIL